MKIKDLAFTAIVGALMAVLAQFLLPVALLIGGPALGPNLVHHALEGIPLGILLAVAYCRCPRGGTSFLIAFVWGFLTFVRVGRWFVTPGFLTGGLLAELVALFFRRFKTDENRLSLALQGGGFMLGMSFFLPVFFALFAGSPAKKLVLHSPALLIIPAVVPALVGLVGGWLGHALVLELRKGGLIAKRKEAHPSDPEN